MELLLAEAEETQFLCLAEPHNTHEIPMFVTSLFERLQDDLSFHYLAIEQGPLIVSQLAELAQSTTNDEIRKISDLVPVILSSGYGEQESTKRFRDKGLAGFIQKPYGVEELRDKLREVLGERD